MITLLLVVCLEFICTRVEIGLLNERRGVYLSNPRIHNNREYEGPQTR